MKGSYVAHVINITLTCMYVPFLYYWIINIHVIYDLSRNENGKIIAKNITNTVFNYVP